MEKIWLQHYSDGVPAEIDPDSWPSLPRMINENIQEFGERPAFSNFGSQISYGEFDHLSRTLAGWFQAELQLEKGDRVAIMLPNLMQYAVALFAALRAGLVVVNVNPLYTPRELKHQLNDAATATIIIWNDVTATLGEIIHETGINNVITTQTDDLLDATLPAPAADQRIGATFSLATILQGEHDDDFAEPALKNTDLAFLQYTGGTTGLSKGAMLSHRNIIANTLQVYALFKPILYETGEIIITALPLYHIYALTCNYFSGIALGGLNVLITNPRDLPGLVSELSNLQFSFITGVNTLYNGLLHTPGFAGLDFSRLHVCSAGGMALQTSVAAHWQEVTGCVMTEGYGLSETSPVLTSNPTSIDEHFGSIGLPVPSTDLSIRDDDGNEVGPGVAGELCACGPQVMTGYWRNEEATAKVMTDDGFFMTGDIATVDERGFFRIVDRKKDMILVSGFNVFPNEVEDVVASMEGVLECACIGVPDETCGEAVVLFLVTHERCVVEEQQVLAWCRDKLSRYKIPRIILFAEDLPKSNVGKILRRELREEYNRLE